MSKFSTDIEKSSGIAALIFGILLFALLLVHLFTLNQIVGIGISFIGIWLLLLSIDTYYNSRIESIIYLIIALISFITGLGLYTHLTFYWLNENNWINLTGLIIILTGFLALIGPGRVEKLAGSIGVVLGILLILIYSNTANLYISVVIIGIWLLVIGVIQSEITYG